MSITKYDDVIDSRDIIDRIEELETLIADESDNKTFLKYTEEYDLLVSLAEEGEQYSDDWLYGSQLIRESYFETYMDEMIWDCYSVPKDLPSFMKIEIDYEALKQDYTGIDFDGVSYYVQ